MPEADRHPVVDHLRHVTPTQGETVRWSLEERMAHYQVPGVSIAVIDQGRLAWTAGFGCREVRSNGLVDAHTLFQAASMSKPVAAAALLREVDDGRLDLDVPVNSYLSGWQVPQTEMTRDHPVTLRRILSHTAGLTVWGFPGYAPDAPLPTVPQVLNGEAPANTPAVFVDVTPGTIERYSGGGTTIGQLVLEERHDQAYEDILWRRVLEPLGMAESTFAQPLPGAAEDRAAVGHDWNGEPVAGRWHTFVEQAAAGLWTTAGDYARFLLGLQQSYAGASESLLRRNTARAMATVPSGGSTFGLGPRIIGRGRAKRMQHGGSNFGYICGSNAFLDGSRGVVVLTNADGGAALAEEIIVAVADVYQWPDYLRAPRRRLPLSSEQARAYAGQYDLGSAAPFPAVQIFADGSALRYRMGTLRERPLFAETHARFFSPESLYDTVFTFDPAGRVAGLKLMEGERVILEGMRSAE